MSKQIPLRNTPDIFALVDDDDYPQVMQHRWNLSSNGYVVSYRIVDGRKRTIFLHREIMNAPRHLQVDHINHVRTDARRSNLRFATGSQNQAYKLPRQRNNTTGYKGVTDAGFKWRVRIRFERRKRLHLGLHDDLVFAALVFDGASRLFNAEFAACNFPDVPTSEKVKAVLRKYVPRNPDALAYLKRVGRLNDLYA